MAHLIALHTDSGAEALHTSPRISLGQFERATPALITPLPFNIGLATAGGGSSHTEWC